MLDVFDHENRAFTLLGFQLEPELLLHGGEDRRAVGQAIVQCEVKELLPVDSLSDPRAAIQ
jgi:hypothetical protein